MNYVTDFSFSFLCWIKRQMASEMHKLPQLKKDIWEILREKIVKCI